MPVQWLRLLSNYTTWSSRERSIILLEILKKPCIWHFPRTFPFIADTLHFNLEQTSSLNLVSWKMLLTHTGSHKFNRIRIMLLLVVIGMLQNQFSLSKELQALLPCLLQTFFPKSIIKYWIQALRNAHYVKKEWFSATSMREMRIPSLNWLFGVCWRSKTS